LDIKLQPVDGCVRYIEAFINEGTKSTQSPKKRTYTPIGINLQQILDDYSNNVDEEAKKNVDEQTKNLTTTPGNVIPNIPGLTDTRNFKDFISSTLNGGLNLNVDIL
jgi:predicted P-loop ATPase/GTPase